ncbi:MAG: hypothetical protein UV60_C0013G0003 [Parcubacteria group bacterium GW2011_GWA2_43_11]|nr:MAG: hypothetical protein UV60_C0013G0003 [Parcubacteria group bacterium GW2011_GWA2_43_11]
MSKELTLRALFGGILSDEMIVDGTTNTLVTFKTKAHLRGHVVWLLREMNKWCDTLSDVPGIVSAGTVRIFKAKKKGEEGGISLGVNVFGQYNMQPDQKVHESIYAKTSAYIRKCVAEEIMIHHSPKIDFDNPLFPKGHISQYYLWLTADHANDKTLEALRQCPLKAMLSILGALEAGFEIFGHRLTVQVRWGEDTDDKEREKVEGVLLAYLEKSGYLSGSRMELVDS